MTADSLNYHKMVRDALRGVPRAALKHVEEHGLPGVHHFYITYDTQYRGVKLSSDLLARYPEYIKIVLQNDFRDLVVEDDRFSVTLHFGGIPHRIVVPFRAILVFEDPTVDFVLPFEPDPESDITEEDAEELLDSEAPAGSLQLPVRAVLAAADRMQAEKEAQEETEDPEASEESVETSDRERQAEPMKASDGKADGKTARAARVADRPGKEPVAEPLAVPAALEEAEQADVGPAAVDEAAKDEEAAEEPRRSKEIAKDNVVSIDAFRRK